MEFPIRLVGCGGHFEMGCFCELNFLLRYFFNATALWKTASWLLLVLALCGRVEILQDAPQVIEGGPILGLVLPAIQHDFIEFSGTRLQALHSIALLQGTDHLRVGHPWKKQAEQSQNLYNWADKAIKFENFGNQRCFWRPSHLGMACVHSW